MGKEPETIDWKGQLILWGKIINPVDKFEKVSNG